MWGVVIIFLLIIAMQTFEIKELGHEINKAKQDISFLSDWYSKHSTSTAELLETMNDRVNIVANMAEMIAADYYGIGKKQSQEEK